jgi:hypothetical protein
MDVKPRKLPRQARAKVTVDAIVEAATQLFLQAGYDSANQRRVTLAECIRAIVDVTLVSHHLIPDLHRIVFDLAPRIDVEEKTENLSRTAAQGIETMLCRHADEIACDIDIATAAIIIETPLEALAHRAVLANPVRLEDNRLASEVTRLIHSYLILGARSPESAGLGGS